MNVFLKKVHVQEGILNFAFSELIARLSTDNIAKYRASQIYVWLYRFGITSFFQMPNLAKNLQKYLNTNFYIYRPEIIEVIKSVDGTVKFLLKLVDGKNIETVYIPDENRKTICVSSQVGCFVGCKFCFTGHQGFFRNLSVEEIVSQVLIVKDFFKMWDQSRLTNIVFMGMGEPLYNAKNVIKAIEILMFDVVEGISKRKITVSTVGISPILFNLASQIHCRLAISLHSANDEIRSKIMPINNKYNIESIIAACKEYSKNNNLRITFEYLLLRDINDSVKCAYELSNLLKDINAKVNLLSFNSWQGCDFLPSANANLFAKILKDEGLEAPIRKNRGSDILSACGQLSSK